ncbi:hypothetical protein IEN85_18680 [Pelagicoccus sp. NFK12]|uniref:Lipoprotein n=1 Tax=Pelagicoccus enzymogenes TaxID=2773457 RepID=A0A927FBV2_9BACT|nr:hypothetical protein [Pelagicoccus enzymogenes]MBD5781534.1 hypothetical protein [Pelagicoccus enzymogenes]
MKIRNTILLLLVLVLSACSGSWDTEARKFYTTLLPRDSKIVVGFDTNNRLIGFQFSGPDFPGGKIFNLKTPLKVSSISVGTIGDEFVVGCEGHWSECKNQNLFRYKMRGRDLVIPTSATGSVSISVDDLIENGKEKFSDWIK